MPSNSDQSQRRDSHPFRLRRLSLEHFKSIRRANVELGPLSVVVGANSSGKSSLLQAVIAMCQAVRTAESSESYPLNGQLQSLGTYQDVHSFYASSTNTLTKIGSTLYDPFTVPEDSADLSAGTHRGPYEAEWLVLLAESDDPASGLALIDSQRITLSSIHKKKRVVARLVTQDDPSEHDDYQETRVDRDPFTQEDSPKDDGMIPLLASLYPQQSRAEIYMNRWWDFVQMFNSINTEKDSSLDKKIHGLQSELEGRQEHSKRVNLPMQLVKRKALQDLEYVKNNPGEQEWNEVELDAIHTRVLNTLDGWVDLLCEPGLAEICQRLPVETRQKLNNKEFVRFAAVIGLAIGDTVNLRSEILEELEQDEWWAEELQTRSYEPGIYYRDGDDRWLARGVANEIVQELFESKVHYLGPLRETPEDMALSGSAIPRSHLGTRGEYTAAVLKSRSDSIIGVPLPDGYEDQVPLGEALARWLRWFGLADDAIVHDRGRHIDLGITPPGTSTLVHLSFVGVGVSQVLPVILLCLLSRPADVLILEQPELHLHPALQKLMADFLLAFVRSGRQVLVETHSDHLVNQLRSQVAADRTDETQKLVRLLFAEQRDRLTTYRESEINQYGGLSQDWPDGFLDISAKSAQDLVRHTLRKRMQQRLQETGTDTQAAG